MKIIPSIVTFLFLIAAGTVSSPAQNATTVEPLLVYKALQDKDCRADFSYMRPLIPELWA